MGKNTMNLGEGTIIDVRNRFELLFGKIKGAMNIPLHKIPSQIEEIRKLPRPIILCCQSGNRSGMAADLLKSKGIACENGGSWFEVKQSLKAAQYRKAS